MVHGDAEEEQKDWVNPFDDSSASQSDRKKRKKKKKKSRKRYTDEELLESESLLDELLSFEDEDELRKKMAPVTEEFCDDDSMGIVRNGNAVDNEMGTNPFDDPEEEEDYGNEYDRHGYNELLNEAPYRVQAAEKESNTNPFEEEESQQEDYRPYGERETLNANPFEEKETQMEATNPFEDSDDEHVYDDESELVQEELDEDSSVDSAGDEVGGHNPFDDESESEADDEASMDDRDESSVEPSEAEPIQHNRTEARRSKTATGSGIKKKASTETADATEKTVSDSFDSAEQIEAVKTEDGVETRFVLLKKNSYEGIVSAASMDPSDNKKKSNPVDDMSDASESESDSDSEGSSASEESSEEDIVESSKRLLRMADQRMQYQQHNDEIKELKNQITFLKSQAEAMSEQLRRAVETKCDLVLAQTEMERCHEQDLICKDDELKDMKLYVQEIMEKSAMNELNFMNEISLLSKSIQDMKENHRSELKEKDFLIAQMDMKLKGMRGGSARGPSRAAFKSRFLETVEETSESGSVSTQ